MVWFLPESPVILYEEGDYHEAKEVYQLIASRNGVKLESFMFDEEEKDAKSGKSGQTHVEPSIGDFLKHKLIRSNLIVFIILFATT